MNYSPFLKMNYEELEIEISKQKKKIESAKETIKLLKKLQIAELAESDQKKTQQLPSSKPEFDQTAKQQNPHTQIVQQTTIFLSIFFFFFLFFSIYIH